MSLSLWQSSVVNSSACYSHSLHGKLAVHGSLTGRSMSLAIARRDRIKTGNQTLGVGAL